MESPHTTPGSTEKLDAAQESAGLKALAWLSVRLWAYGGPWGKLSDLAWAEDTRLAELIREVLTKDHGRILEQHRNMVVASFANPIHALSAAKTLQQRLLTHQCKLPEQQAVSAMVVQGRGGTTATDSGARIMPVGGLLVEAHSSQILVTEEVFESAKNLPAFRFKPKPAHETAEGGFPETIYELLWTDESTYGHLRKVGERTDVGASGASRYQIEAELGRGAMGVVYKAYDQIIGRTVALKTIAINRNAPDRQELIERLKQEAKAAGGLDHPNIITIYDVGQEDDLVYLSMQFVEGKTLLALLNDGPVPSLPTLVSYAEQICSAVGFAHKKGVSLRDLKPANFMLTDQGTIKVLDFGIAKIGDATLTQPGMVIGTPTYMAPEQVKGKKLDHRADIFALGSVFYELFTREKPFKGDVTTILYKIIHEDPVPPALINPALPGGIDALVRTALAKDPNDRFQSCEEMREVFRQQAKSLKTATATHSTGTGTAAAARLQPQPVAASPNYLLETTSIRLHKSRWLGFTMLLLVAAAAGVGGWAFYVKSKTGLFPPAVQKVLSALHQEKSPPDAPSVSQPPVESATNNAAETAKPAPTDTNADTTADSNKSQTPALSSTSATSVPPPT